MSLMGKVDLSEFIGGRGELQLPEKRVIQNVRNLSEQGISVKLVPEQTILQDAWLVGIGKMNPNLDAWFDIQSKKLDDKEKKTGIDAITGERIRRDKSA